MTLEEQMNEEEPEDILEDEELPLESLEELEEQDEEEHL